MLLVVSGVVGHNSFCHLSGGGGGGGENISGETGGGGRRQGRKNLGESNENAPDIHRPIHT